MISIRTALASALTVAALSTVGVYVSHEASTQTSRPAVSHVQAGPLPCCDAIAVKVTS
jgi:hypothetical protein